MDEQERRTAGRAEIARFRGELRVAFRPRCSDCRFGPLDGAEGRCEHFVHWRVSPDRRLSIPVSTTQARAEGGLCGPDALLFEAYGPVRGLVRKLRRYNPLHVFLVGLVVVGTVIGTII